MAIRPSTRRTALWAQTDPLLVVSLTALLVSACAYDRRSTPVSTLPRTVAVRADPPPYLWRVVFIDAEIPPRKRSGREWDDDEGLPDAYVKLSVDGRELWKGPTAPDSLRPNWEAFPPRNVLISPSDKVGLELWDEDGLRSDPIGTYEGRALSGGLEGAHTVVKLEGGATVTVRLERPQPMAGMGIELYEVRSEALRIVTVLPHSPAERAGLAEGDEIIAIDDKPVKRLGPTKAASNLALAAQRGSRLEVRRDGASREVVIDRGYIWPTM